jgi:xylulose-5-phosphate/fructose-6-phosphate phosphoketolase
MDRFQLSLDAIRRISRLKNISDKATERFYELMQRHKIYVSENGEDLPEVKNWRWPF